MKPKESPLFLIPTDARLRAIPREPSADGVICLGASEAFRLRWINGRIEREQLPELPRGTFLSSLDRLV